MKNRLGHKMPKPMHLINEIAAAEILIHLGHIGPMNLDQLYESINSPAEPKRMSTAVLTSAVQLLQNTGLAKQIPGPVNRKKTLYAVTTTAVMEIEEIA